MMTKVSPRRRDDDDVRLVLGRLPRLPWLPTSDELE